MGKLVLSEPYYQGEDTSSGDSSLTLNETIGLQQIVCNTGSGGYTLTVNYGSNVTTLSDGMCVWVMYDGTSWRLRNTSEAEDVVYNPTSPLTETTVQGALDETANLLTPVTKAGCQCDIDGRGTPQFPDNPDGVTYKNYDFTSIDIFTVARATASFVDGDLVLTATDARPGIYYATTAWAEKQVVLSVTRESGEASTLQVYDGANYYNYDWGCKKQLYVRLFLPSTTTQLLIIFGDTGSAVSDIYKLKKIYVGDGSTLTGIADKSGLHVSLTNFCVLPADGDSGKALEYNGETSYSEAQTPILACEGTYISTFKMYELDREQTFMYSYLINGVRQYINSDNLLRLAILSDSVGMGISTESTISDYLEHQLSWTIEGTTLKIYFDGDYVKTSTITALGVFTQNLLFGASDKLGDNTTSKTLNGYNNFYHTSEIFDASSIKSYYNNPPHSNNEPVSETGLPYSKARRNMDGDLEANSFIASGVPTYADNTAALAGGLVANQFYRTSTGVLMITY